MKEDLESWRSFLTWLKERGLKGTKLFIGDRCLGMLEAINEVFPDTKYQGAQSIFTGIYSPLSPIRSEK